MSDSKKIFIPAAVFIAAEAAAWVSVQFTDGNIQTAICYSSVLCALAFSSYLLFINARGLSTVAGMLFTAFADFCLVVLSPSPRVIAMLFFSVAQLCYAVRLALSESDKKAVCYHIIARGSATLVLELAMLAVLGSSADALTVITMFYFANLAVSLFIAFFREKNILFQIGLLCFILCDIFVGLGVLISDYITVSETSFLYKITHTGINIIWFFYIPSQTLISLSILKNSKRTKINN